MSEDLWKIVEGKDCVVAAALHDGHELRREVADRIALPESHRLREEDPFTALWAQVATTTLVPRRSRFEVDLNRPSDRAVYLSPDDAWGLEVWGEPPPEDLVDRSRADYDAFYAEAHRVLTGVTRNCGRFVVLDIHTYNHRREGPRAVPADPLANPEVNIGTGTLDRELWGDLADRFIDDMRSFDYLGRHLDVRENVRFRGGHFSQWVHESFPDSGCCLAIEFKKFFMDEWSGALFDEQAEAITGALQATLTGLRRSLAEVQSRGRG